MPELLIFLGFILPLALWQLYDVKKAKQQSAKRREQAAADALKDQEPSERVAPAKVD
jgi:cytochrome c-type biogenesis protein CcmH/NrfG